MAIDDVEATFRARMRALARKGGAVTKRRHGYDPAYYRDIGGLGGSASVAARKARILAELEDQGCEPTVTTTASSAHSPPQIQRHLTLADIVGVRSCSASGACFALSSSRTNLRATHDTGGLVRGCARESAVWGSLAS